MIKRFLGFLVAMLLFSVGFGAHAQESNFLGSWYLISVKTENMTLSAADIGLSVVLAFSEDGTVEMVMGDETNSSTWRIQDDSAIIDDHESGVSIVCTLDGDWLVATGDDNDIMTFGREPAEPAEAIETAPVRQDASIADFAGAWQMTYMTMENLRLPADTIGMEFFLIVQDSAATVAAFGLKHEDVACIMDGFSLIVDIPENPIQFVLHEDGALSCDMGDNNLLWLERTQEPILMD